MALTQEQISRLWKLSALNADSNTEIDSVLASVEAISRSNTDGVNALSRSGNNVMTPREDAINENENIPDALLSCSPQKVAAHQIVLAGIMQGE